MAITSAYTLKEARDKLACWKDAEDKLASGQAKAYKIGTREYTALDMDKIVRQIERFAAIIDAYEDQRMQTRVKSVVPRDL